MPRVLSSTYCISRRVRRARARSLVRLGLGERVHDVRVQLPLVVRRPHRVESLVHDLRSRGETGRGSAVSSPPRRKKSPRRQLCARLARRSERPSARADAIGAREGREQTIDATRTFSPTSAPATMTPTYTLERCGGRRCGGRRRVSGWPKRASSGEGNDCISGAGARSRRRARRRGGRTHRHRGAVESFEHDLKF